MKFLKRIFVLTLVLTATFLLNNQSCLAAETQYTDNVIPVMTSNTSPSGEASASNNDTAWHAFDHIDTNNESVWFSSADNNGWLAYEFSTPKCITKYTIVTRGLDVPSANRAPRTWTFEGWDEGSSKWITLDKQSDVTSWTLGVKKEFTFLNNNLYKKYRINVTATLHSAYHLAIADMEMMETVTAPTNLTATAGDSNISLSWNNIKNAGSYNIKRSTNSGGPYETIATGSAVSFTDTTVVNGTTYYYVVSAVVSGTESSSSNEASATPMGKPINTSLKVVLEVREELQLSVDDDLNVNTELTWTSSDESVATVNENGIVKALAPGNTVITVASEDGTYIDYINVLVVKDVKDYRLAIDLKVGKSCRLTIDDYTNTIPVKWSSMDLTVATVSGSGKVTAVGKGLTIITATDDQGNKIGQIYVRVRE